MVSQRVALEEQLLHAGVAEELGGWREDEKSSCNLPSREITMEPIDPVETAHKVRATPALESQHPFPERLAQSHSELLQVFDAAAASDTPILSIALSYFMSRKGKLLRPLLTLLSCEVAGGDPKHIVPLAAAVELVHCSSIILDDLPCMDNSATRRGQASLHTQFGEAIAILASVHLLSRAFNIAAGSEKTIGRNAVATLTDAISSEGMIHGQLVDLDGGGCADEVRLLKTAPLFRIATQFGAYAAGAPSRQVDALTKFSDCLSLVFQIRDDIIDGEIEPALLQTVTERGAAAAKELVATFGRTAPCSDLVSLIDFAVSREA
jgi:geranylgeranyl diphosphate synthase, type II